MASNEETMMPNCTEMKTGEIYVCPDCGLELQVIKSCSKEGASTVVAARLRAVGAYSVAVTKSWC